MLRDDQYFEYEAQRQWEQEQKDIANQMEEDRIWEQIMLDESKKKVAS